MKDILKASLLAAITGSIVITVLSLAGGSLAWVFGLIFAPIAFVFCLVLAIPMIKLSAYLKEPYYFISFLIVGFVVGVLIEVIFFSISSGGFDTRYLVKHLVFGYGGLGVICSLTAWWYLKKNEKNEYFIENKNGIAVVGPKVASFGFNEHYLVACQIDKKGNSKVIINLSTGVVIDTLNNDNWTYFVNKNPSLGFITLKVLTDEKCP